MLRLVGVKPIKYEIKRYLSKIQFPDGDFVGFTENANGSYTFYTRGMDRLSSVDGDFFQRVFEIPFLLADAIWTLFQNMIQTFVQ